MDSRFHGNDKVVDLSTTLEMTICGNQRSAFVYSFAEATEHKKTTADKNLRLSKALDPSAALRVASFIWN